jgi:hypothetical protein
LLAGRRARSVASARPPPVDKSNPCEHFSFLFLLVLFPGRVFTPVHYFSTKMAGAVCNGTVSEKQTNFELHLIAQANSFPLSEKSK